MSIFIEETKRFEEIDLDINTMKSHDDYNEYINTIVSDVIDLKKVYYAIFEASLLMFSIPAAIFFSLYVFVFDIDNHTSYLIMLTACILSYLITIGCIIHLFILNKKSIRSYNTKYCDILTIDNKDLTHNFKYTAEFISENGDNYNWKQYDKTVERLIELQSRYSDPAGEKEIIRIINEDLDKIREDITKK